MGSHWSLGGNSVFKRCGHNMTFSPQTAVIRNQIKIKFVPPLKKKVQVFSYFIHFTYQMVSPPLKMSFQDVDDCALKDLELWRGWFMSCTFKGIMRYQKKSKSSWLPKFSKTKLGYPSEMILQILSKGMLTPFSVASSSKMPDRFCSYSENFQQYFFLNIASRNGQRWPPHHICSNIPYLLWLLK